ncbi:MAG TPA: helicase-related protein, partial [Bdellovibrionota bacterium]|nr:helicase-related protein [Bdellovibrionota bacterium]
MERLPIDTSLHEILTLLERNSSLVLQAEPGAGKTTRVPPALLRATWCGDKEVLVLEPRRLAAKLAAMRVAHELGEAPGQTVGYQFRFEKVEGPRTRLRFLTEGLLTRRLLGDPSLSRVAAVVVDEFHERHLVGDVALAALRRLQKTTRPDLKLVVMSATIDIESVSAYLGGCPSLKVAGRVFPVEVEHVPKAVDLPLEVQVKRAALTALGREDAGDLLVFLPGMGEIRRCESALRDADRVSELDALVLPLHGDLTRDEQDRAVGPNKRQKIILSTNVAETSVTIPGVRTVIDSGLARVASFSWWSGLPALRLRPVSRASAVQRAGRAGRMAPGRCMRLYTQHDFSTRPPFETPEIRRADLAQTLLELCFLVPGLGVGRAADFEWFEAPGPGAIEAAEKLLYLLGAVESDGRPTGMGRRMADLGIPPRLARLAIDGARLGRGPEAAAVAAFLSELRAERVDFLDDAVRAWKTGGLGFAGTRLQERIERALTAERALSDLAGAPRPGSTLDGDLARALLTAFPDRVAKLRRQN